MRRNLEFNYKNRRRQMAKSEMNLGHRRVIVQTGLVLILGVVAACVGESGTDKILKWKLSGFRMYINKVLKDEVMEEVIRKDVDNRIVQLGKWPGGPLEVSTSIGEARVHARFEKDFIIIWYHSPVLLVDSNSSPLDVVRDATSNVLADVFVLGGPDTLVRSSARATDKTEIRLTRWPEKISGTDAIVCSYYPQFDNKRRWEIIEWVHVLIRGKDCVVVLGKATGRTAAYQFGYHGLDAGKAKLASNVIFPPETDLKGVPEVLLNGCMWPIEDHIAVGSKDVGPASFLKRKRKIGDRKKSEK